MTLPQSSFLFCTTTLGCLIRLEARRCDCEQCLTVSALSEPHSSYRVLTCWILYNGCFRWLLAWETLFATAQSLELDSFSLLLCGKQWHVTSVNKTPNPLQPLVVHQPWKKYEKIKLWGTTLQSNLCTFIRRCSFSSYHHSQCHWCNFDNYYRCYSMHYIVASIPRRSKESTVNNHNDCLIIAYSARACMSKRNQTRPFSVWWEPETARHPVLSPALSFGLANLGIKNYQPIFDMFRSRASTTFSSLVCVAWRQIPHERGGKGSRVKDIQCIYRMS